MALREIGKSALPPTPIPPAANPAFKLLQATNVSDLIPSQQSQVLAVKSTDSIADVASFLQENRILSTPVVDPDASMILGFADVGDLISYMLGTISEMEGEIGLEKLKELVPMKAIGSNPIQEVVNYSKRDPWVPDWERVHAGFVVRDMAQFGLHRVPIQATDGTLTHIIAQQDVLDFLAKHNSQWKDLGEMTIGDLGLGKDGVACVKKDTYLFDALKKMQLERVTGLGIVDANGALCSGFGLSDILPLFTQEQNLAISIWDWMTACKRCREPIAVSAGSATLREVIEKMTNEKVHCVFTLSGEKPVGIVTATDVISLIVTFNMQ